MSMAAKFCQLSWPCSTTSTIGCSSRRRLFAYETPTFGNLVIGDKPLRRHQANTERSTSIADTSDLWVSLSNFLDMNDGAQNAGQGSLLGLSASLFNDDHSFVMEKETPSEYVPAPPVDPEEMELNKHLEDILYMLRDVLPGPTRKAGMEHKLVEAWRQISNDIKVQDPLVCMEGKGRLQAWLHALQTVNAEVELHDVYAERLRGAWPFKGNVCAVWTLLFMEEPHLAGTFGRLSLSGESKFEVDSTGQIVSVESQWYVIKEGKEMSAAVKMCLSSLLLKEEENYSKRTSTCEAAVKSAHTF